MLIHARKSVTGSLLNTFNQVVSDPDLYDVPSSKNYKLSSEEIDTRKDENILRTENDVELRAEL